MKVHFITSFRRVLEQGNCRKAGPTYILMELYVIRAQKMSEPNLSGKRRKYAFENEKAWLTSFCVAEANCLAGHRSSVDSLFERGALLS